MSLRVESCPLEGVLLLSGHHGDMGGGVRGASVLLVTHIPLEDGQGAKYHGAGKHASIPTIY